MINIRLSEELIEQLLNELLQPGSNTPAFKLRVYPGDLEDLGKPINANHVVVQFSRINYDNKQDRNFNLCKVTQMNVVYFTILVQTNNLRNHREVYDIAQAVVRKLRGQKILVNDDREPHTNQNCCRVSQFSFKNISNGGVCYQSTIEIESTYTDIYTEDCK